MAQGIALFAVAIVLYAALAAWLGRWSVTMPMVFVAVGFLLGPGGTGLLQLSPEAEEVKRLTEATLALLLFADASTLDLKQVRDDARLPLRLLTIGMVLTISLGTVAALGLLPAEGLAFAALLGAILAPTDAALGLPIFTNPQVPVRIRRVLNVESGLNDGIATPFVTLFVAFAVATEASSRQAWLSTALLEIALGLLVGTVAGVVGGWLLLLAVRSHWTSGASEQIATLGLALFAYVGSLVIGGNSFIAAFVAGIVLGAVTRNRLAEPIEFTETFSTFLSLLVWGIFGAILVADAFRFATDWRPFAYAVLSLTVVRMVPVAIALRGTRLRGDTIALMGWFGPRGLASVVFTLLAFERFQEAGRPIDALVATATWTILLSVLAHGLSAKPLSAWYARRLKAASDARAEMVEMPELRPRRSVLGDRRKT
jgi:sodium/hydrogen antiporter